MNFKVFVPLSLATLVLIYALWHGFGHDPHEVPFMLTNKPAPAFSLKRVDNGDTMTLAQFAGKPLVMNFWSTWCVPCKQEHPVFQWAQEKLGSKIQFIGVLYEDTDENVHKFLKNNPMNFPQLIDPSGRVEVDYGLAGVPETYFIDPHGMIRYKQVGPIDPDTMLAKLTDLLSVTP